MSTASIIITTHNRPHLLARAVMSAFAAAGDVEVVVVDDASSDETQDVCRSILGINYVRVERNQGVAGARNLGLLASHGEYVTFLDDDDTRLAESLDKQIEMLDRAPDAAMIYGCAIFGDQDGRPTGQAYPEQCQQGDLFWPLLARNFIPCGTALFRRDCLRRIGLLDEDAPGVDDWDLWVRLSEIWSIIVTASPIIIWRRSSPVSAQGSSHAARIVSHSIRQFRERWMNLPRYRNAPESRRRETWKKFCENMAEHLIWESGVAVRHGQLARSVEILSLIPRLHPYTLMRTARHRLGTNTRI
jgi:glycosyltransferase involved in cell wall biosynthesis